MWDSEVSLDDLAVAVAIVRHGGVRAAAAKLGVPRSTLSRRLSRIEAALETRLIERTAQGVVLTSTGAEHFGALAEALDNARDIVARLRDGAREPSGNLRITAAHAFAESFLVPLMARFLERYPRVNIELLLTRRRIDLSSERIDVAFRSAPLPSSDAHTSRRLGEYVRGFFASPAYLARHPAPRTLGDLATHQLLATTARGNADDWVLEGLGKPLSHVRLRAQNANVITRACLGGLGIARLPLLSVESALAARQLVPLLRDHWLTASIFAIFPRGTRAAKTRAFLDMAVELLPSDFGGVSAGG